MWEPNNLFYITVLTQIIVTLMVVPRLIRFNLIKSFSCHLNTQNESLKETLSSTIKRYIMMCNVLSMAALCLVCYAWYNQTELLNWDNQAGVILLSLMAGGTIVFISFGLHKCRKLSLELSHGIRRASLKAKRWQEYLPPNLVMMIIISQIVYLGSVFYFMSNPFEGFAGAANLIGIAIINGVFVLSIVKVLTKSNFPADITEHQKVLGKLRGTTISCVVWLLASLYLTISLWLAAFSLKDIQLLSQSFYMMIILLIGTRFFELPNENDFK